MKFISSSETARPVAEKVRELSWMVKSSINESLARLGIDCETNELRYVPIIMPVNMHSDYPERTKVYKVKGNVDLAPHLSYETFLANSYEKYLSEYMKPLRSCSSVLLSAGFNAEDVHGFLQITRDIELGLAAEQRASPS